MAAGEYLKAAASSLYRAAEHLKQQGKEMQANIGRIQADKRTLINKNTVEMRARQAEQVGVHDQGQQSRLAAEIAKLQHEIMAAEQEMKQAEADFKNAAAAKLSQSMAIETQAKQLESQAGAID